mgnify:CR=1 FL=1|uniref:hypothetical protein n=1 Tax=Candidatus Scatocola faecipullorum TaxID=2840917 RepID=UPI004024B8E3
MDWKIFFLENKEYLIGGSLTILGIFIGWLLNLIQAIFQNKRDDALYLKRKREELYVKMYDFLMRFEKDIRIRKNTYMAKETKDLLNIIQIESIWGNKQTTDMFYKLWKELYESLPEYKNNFDKIFDENNEKILTFQAHIRKELGIKN